MIRERLLSVKQMTVKFDDRVVVDGLSFDVAPGEIVALVGESGSGKTLAARTLLDLLPFGARATGGVADFQGKDLLDLGAVDMRAIRGVDIGMIFQEPMTSLDPSMKIGPQMAEGLKLHLGLDDAECTARSLVMLAKIRIADPVAALDSYPHQFSGGMRQRISIASAMLLKPALLIADEPTTALDVLVQKEVLDLLVGLTRDAETGVLLITHDLGLVAEYADRVVVMRQGRLVEEGAVKPLLASPAQAYTRALLAAVPRRSARPRPVAPGHELLRITNLQVQFAGRRLTPWRSGPAIRPVDGVSLTLKRGETLAIVGESGSGKTTLVKSVLRLVDIASGSITLDGTDVTGLAGKSLCEYRKRVRIVFQDPFSALDPRMRVCDVVAEGLRHERGLKTAKRDSQVIKILSEVGLGTEFLHRLPHQLSGGQRQRVNIARALIANPELVIADEPVSALDVTVQEEVLRLLESLQKSRGFACLFITHALGVVEQIADHIAVIFRGKIVEEGSRDDIFDRPHHPYTCALLRAAPRVEANDAGGFQFSSYGAASPPPPSGWAYSPWLTLAPGIDPNLIEVAPGHRVSFVPATERKSL